MGGLQSGFFRAVSSAFEGANRVLGIREYWSLCGTELEPTGALGALAHGVSSIGDIAL